MAVGIAGADPGSGKQLTDSQLILPADQALYRSKHAGRNRFTR
jgi:FOG: GGDEF domain